jgi:predicted membrane protein
MMSEVNYLAVIAAAASAFVLGGLWYGPLFKVAWCREAGVNPDSKTAHPGAVFGAAFVLSMLAAYVFALFLGPKPALQMGIEAGFAAGLCWVGTSFGINYLFARRSLKLWMIDAGYHTLQFTLYGIVLGLWH